ncbi:MAG: hypothetical protein PHH54_03745 [Candidatus Nanoarchaeia archaeon]|nr:hypothetical protein [Candidatus Nanoarchaeia archaeon]MDD5741072.1 hypothetical protein [Candidatus Nanoarchaeia archaeon]
MLELKKSELKTILLEQMCDIAERIDEFYYDSYILPPLTNTHFNGRECPEPFKPGVADKFIFNKIIDEVIDNVYNELFKGEYQTSLMGLNVLTRFYYPQFGGWKIMPQLSIEEINRYL